MPNEPLTGARYPTSDDAATLWTYFQNLASDLADNTIPRFASTAARNSAYAAWVAAGNAMVDGLHCWVTGIGDQVYLSGDWRQAGGLWGDAWSGTGFAGDGTDTRVTGGTNWTGTLVTGRKYRVDGSGIFTTDTIPNHPEVFLRGARTAAPTSAAPILTSSRGYLTETNRQKTWTFYGVFGVTVTGTHFLSLFFRRFGGAGTVTLAPGDSGIYGFAITDIGPSTAGIPLIP